MKPAPFKYIAATSLQQALSLKAEHGDEAKFLAGGQSLMPAMNFRLAQPAILIDINQIDELAGIRPDAAGATHIGALTRYRQFERDAVRIANPQLQRRKNRDYAQHDRALRPRCVKVPV